MSRSVLLGAAGCGSLHLSIGWSKLADNGRNGSYGTLVRTTVAHDIVMTLRVVNVSGRGAYALPSFAIVASRRAAVLSQ